MKNVLIVLGLRNAFLLAFAACDIIVMDRSVNSPAELGVKGGPT